MANAADVCKYLKRWILKRADCVISGFAISHPLPQKRIREHIRGNEKVIGKRVSFITFQYSMVKRKFFEQFFDIRRNLCE